MATCSCPVCLSLDHRDQRLRSSLYLETKNKQKILVDTGPDLRMQVLQNKIHTIDSVIVTHEHADHLHGLDDLRPFSFGPSPKTIPLYTNTSTKEFINERFPYIFVKNKLSMPRGGSLPKLELKAVEMNTETMIGNDSFYFFNYPHGPGITMGFIHESFAYIVDCMELPEDLLIFLKEKKLKLLIIDCLQKKDHPTHLNVEKCFAYIEKIAPLKAGLIHIGHDLSHRQLESLCVQRFKKNVFPLYDQQKIFY